MLENLGGAAEGMTFYSADLGDGVACFTLKPLHIHQQFSKADTALKRTQACFKCFYDERPKDAEESIT
jgi:hypothetical protein